MAKARILPKTPEPLSFDHDGWFTGTMPGFGSEIKNFQMVPVGEDRLITVTVEDTECFVYSRAPSDLEVSGVNIVDPATLPNRIRLAPRGAPFQYTIKLHGLKSSRTYVIVCDAAGTTIDSVEVGVKDVRLFTYRLWALMDVARRTHRTKDRSQHQDAHVR